MPYTDIRNEVRSFQKSKKLKNVIIMSQMEFSFSLIFCLKNRLLYAFPENLRI